MLYQNEILLQDVAYVFNMLTVLEKILLRSCSDIVIGQGNFKLK